MNETEQYLLFAVTAVALLGTLIAMFVQHRRGKNRE